MPAPILSGRIGDLMRFFSSLSEWIDPRRLPAIIPAIGRVLDNQPPLDSPANIEVRIREVLTLMQTIADASLTDRDDKLIADLDAILSNPVLMGLLVAAVQWAAGSDATAGGLPRLPMVLPGEFFAAGVSDANLDLVATSLSNLYPVWSR